MGRGPRARLTGAPTELSLVDVPDHLDRARSGRRCCEEPDHDANQERSDDQNGEQGEHSEFAEFVVEIEVARVAVETDCLETIHRAIKGSEEKPGDVKAAFRMLEKIRPEQWSTTHRLEHSGSVNLVEQHAEQLLEPLMGILADLGMAEDPRVPDLIEKHFTPLERMSDQPH